MARLSRECFITEKIDGTNAQITITEDGQFLTGSRTRWIVPGNDNYGFAAWAHANKEVLMQLGVGRHFGEWWGQGIQRNYGQTTKRFSLFNASRWGFLSTVSPEQNPLAGLVSVVPTLYVGDFTTQAAEDCLDYLRINGSKAAPGFMKPEGIVVYHTAANIGFKKTVENDSVPKSLVK